jgi:hypothetical protein
MCEETKNLKNALFYPEMMKISAAKEGGPKDDSAMGVTVVSTSRDDGRESLALNIIELIKREGTRRERVPHTD